LILEDNVTFERITALPSRKRRFGMTLMALAALLFCLMPPSLFAQSDGKYRWNRDG